MTRHWLASGVVFAMMTGAALAQGMSSDSSTSTQSTTTATAPSVGSYSSSETARGMDSSGNAVRLHKSHHWSANGSRDSSSSRHVSADGSMRSSYHRVKTTASPDTAYGDSTTDSKTTTMTDHE
jgi:hypothetical protein